MATSGQTLNDRINAARYALAGQGLARCVCKATTEEVIGPKKKHLDYLLACTHEPNVSIPQLANLLIERTNHIYWVVVFKALVTVHHLMSYGNERFFQYIASSNYSFELSTFLDKTAARDFTMSTYIRRYSRYINEKALSYRLLAFDFCKVKRGKEGVLRLMPIERLLKTLPILQNQLDALLEFDCSANDLNNGVINACFMLLFRDLIGLYACHNDGIINLLEKYFSLNRRMCREAFELYKKFLIRMDKVSDFLRVAESVGIDKDDIPDVRRAPNSLIDALGQHLQNLDSNKKMPKQQLTGSQAIGSLTPPNVRRSDTPTSVPSSNDSQAQQQQSDDFSSSNLVCNFKDDEVRKALEEEAKVLSRYGSGGSKGSKSASKSALGSIGSQEDSPKPSASIAQTKPKTIDDIFGDSDSFGNVVESCNNNNINVLENNEKSGFEEVVLAGPTNLIKPPPVALEKPPTQIKKASDELFSLLDGPAPKLSTTNDLVSTNLTSQVYTNGNKATTGLGLKNPFPDTDDDFGIGFNMPNHGQSQLLSTQHSSSIPAPANECLFNSSPPAANYTNIGGLDGFGDFLHPVSSGNKTSKPNFGTTSSGSGLFKGDLDSTLASLAQNLTFEGVKKTKK